MKKLITEIFDSAKKKGLKNISIRITESQKEGRWFVLYVGEKDRFACQSLKSLLCALLEHDEDLSWMN